MTFDEIRLKIQIRMAAWTDAPAWFDNSLEPPTVKEAKANKSAWTRLTINHGDSFTASIGDRPVVRKTGLIQVQIFTAINVGSDDAARIADSIAAHLEHWQSGKLFTRSASMRRAGESNGYYMVLVNVPFVAD